MVQVRQPLIDCTTPGSVTADTVGQAVARGYACRTKTRAATADHWAGDTTRSWGDKGWQVENRESWRRINMDETRKIYSKSN